jgi:Ras-related protein Rab-11A
MSEQPNTPATEEQTSPQFHYEVMPDDYTQYDLSFKVIVIGDSGVGKSCLTNKATNNIFEENYNATVGFEFFTFNIKMFNKIIKLQIWDTCGQELYRSLITNFYRNSSLAIIVYAINSKASFESIDMWLKELRTHSNPDAKVFLIANKIDLEKDRKISKEEGEKFKEVNKLDYFMEASAKTGVNAQNIFVQAAKMLYEDYLKYKTDDETVESEQSLKTMELSSKKIDSKKPKTGGCC